MQIRVQDIRHPRTPLRRVDTTTESYQGLKVSIRQDGLLSPITVYDLGEGKYEVIDGGHRLQAHKDLGIDFIEAWLSNATKQDSLRLQMVHNVHRVPVSNKEYADAVAKLLKNSSIEQLSMDLRISPQWLLKIIKIAETDDERIIKILEERKVPITAVMELMRLCFRDRGEFIPLAYSYSVSALNETISTFLRTKKANATCAKDFVQTSLGVTKYFRGYSAVETEQARKIRFRQLEKGGKLKSLEDAWTEALKWVMCQDETGKKILKQKTENFKKLKKD